MIEEMKTAGVFIFSDGGLDESTVVCSVADDAEARYWAGRIAVAVGFPQEVHRFPHRVQLETETHIGESRG